MREYITKLESALLELGAEVCSMKSEIRDVLKSNQQLQETISVLKELLDHKDILSQEDLDLALVEQSLKPSLFDELNEDSSLHTPTKKSASKMQH